MPNTGRLFLCARCRVQVVICRDCDRGQIYCGQDCAQAARRASLRQAGQRYQSSRRGQFAHAQRMCRYRQRLNKVTHQGSLTPPPDDLLSSTPTPRTTAVTCRVVQPELNRCRFCQRLCLNLVRTQALRGQARRDLRGARDKTGKDP